MTTFTAPELLARAVVARTTPFERALLRAASAIDSFVVARFERRTGGAGLRAAATQDAVDRSRREAEARGAIGILPR